MLLKYPWILSTGVIENYRRILSFFNRKKVTEKKILLCMSEFPVHLFTLSFLLFAVARSSKSTVLLSDFWYSPWYCCETLASYYWLLHKKNEFNSGVV